MNALYQNPYTHAWRELGQKIPKPKAILCISAHWYMPGTAVTFDEQPRTIHDFGGFPRELYQVQYPAPGNQELALAVQQTLAPLKVDLDHDWGLDHGTWSVLCHVYPDANIPIVQLSINETKPAEFHFEIGTKLSSLRDQGILVIGSGNIVHNLHTYAWGRHAPEPYDWAVRFENNARELMLAGNFKPLIDYESFGKDAILSIPTPDHYLPLLYVLGTWQQGETISFPVEGVDGGSISMLAVQLGG
jgi:4,5-DOPA dioxygenase extradiol